MLWGFVFAISVAVAGDPCSNDREVALRLPPKAFDEDQRLGWRWLGDRPSCLADAAELIAAHRRRHWGEFTVTQLHASYWHEAQMRAASGQAAQAIPLFLAGSDPDAFGSADYALATVAFLNHDLPGLTAARARLSSLAKPPGFDEAAAELLKTQRTTLSWPPNLDVVDGFIACFDQPYRVAYGDACRR